MPLIQTSHGPIWCADQRHADHAGSPLLLIHGAAGTHLDWSLALRKRHALAPDLPAHGRSPGPPPATLRACADALAALLDALGVPRVIAVGQSMGGGIALALALAHPQRVAGLVLIGTGARLPVNPDLLARIQTDQAGLGESFKKWMWARATSQPVRQRGFELFMQCPPEVVYADYAACAAFDVTARLGEISAPALVIAADEDRMLPNAISAALADGLPQARYVLLAGAGHLMVIEQAEAVAALVDDWRAAHGI